MQDTTPAATLQEGDIVFIASPFYLYRRVAEATGSPTSHVGILFRNRRRWVVAESRVPVSQYTPLARFLARSDGWFAIRRVRGGLTQDQIGTLRAACDEQMGLPYDFGFDYDARSTFCSKFVFEAYRRALGMQLGELESFADLLGRTPDAPLGFWKAWYLGTIPWQRRTVTPASQLRTPVLQTVMHAGVAV